MSETNTIIKLYPELSAFALSNKLDKEMSLWYCLRSIDNNGCGYLDLKDSREKLIHKYNYSHRGFDKFIQSGKEKLWTIRIASDRKKKIQLHGIEMIAEAADVPFLTDSIEYNGEDFNTLKRRRAILYASFLSERNEKTIARQTIEHVTQIKRQTQKNYEKTTKITKTESFAWKRNEEHHLTPIYKTITTKTKTYQIQEQLPNSYIIPNNFQKTNKGMIRKINRRLRKLRSFSGIKRGPTVLNLCYFPEYSKKYKYLKQHMPDDPDGARTFLQKNRVMDPSYVQVYVKLLKKYVWCDTGFHLTYF